MKLLILTDNNELLFERALPLHEFTFQNNGNAEWCSLTPDARADVMAMICEGARLTGAVPVPVATGGNVVPFKRPKKVDAGGSHG